MTPNRLEAQLATGLLITCPDDALAVGKKLVESLALEAALITLDRDGMALVRKRWPSQVGSHSCPERL